MKKPRRSARLLKGSCLCGAVAFSVRDEFTYALNCHCSQCRRTTGAAYKPFGGIPKTKFRLERGTRSLLIYGDAEGYNAHCKVCGSPLYAVVRAGKYVHVNYGALTRAPSLRPTAHIYVGSKAPWHTITDDLPQHDELGG